LQVSAPEVSGEEIMIDHVSVPVRDLAKACAFYESVLAPLGLRKLVVREATIGFGKSYPELWLNLREFVPQTSNPGGHICLRAPNEDAVRAFHAAALSNGGTDDGGPGPRQAAFTTYFGAFILDADGNKLEAVTFPKQKIV
jgi:catechol 2,3-dioxygenase-like lactoylglutathione lyase family enzyme